MSEETVTTRVDDLLQEVRALEYELSNLKNAVYSLDNLRSDIPSMIRLHRHLLNNKIIEIEPYDEYLRLNTETGEDVLEYLTEEGWRLYRQNVENLLVDISHNYKHWKVCEDSPTEIALIKTSQL